MSILDTAQAKMQTMGMCSTNWASHKSPSSKPEAGLILYQPADAFRKAEPNLNWVSTVLQIMCWNGLEEVKNI